MTQKRKQRAFTLVESLLAASILAMSITAITMPFTSAAKNEQINARRTIATSFAQELMEEILTRSFEDPEPAWARSPGPEPNEYTRDDFDNIDDYHDYSDNPAETSALGSEITEHTGAIGLTRNVTAEYVYVTGQEASEEPDFIRILVEIRYQEHPVLSVSRLVFQIPTE